MPECKGIEKELCQKTEDCIWTNGIKRQYCRTKKNKNKKEVSIKNIQTENYILLNFGKITNKKPIGGFDIDWTIIRPKSGKKMPKNKDDWMLMYENVPARLTELSKEYQLVFITNQKGLKTKEKQDDFIEKINNIQILLNIPLIVLISLKDGWYRKPFTGLYNVILDYLDRKQNKKDFYCGDAAGREKDFANTDFGFAYNSRIIYFVPEQIFLGKEEEITITRPESLIKYIGESNKITIPKEKKLCILMCGYQGSGKSSLSKSLGIERISNDIQGSLAKTKKKAKSLMDKEQSFIIDNVNHTRLRRKMWIDMAREKSYKTMIIWVDNNIEFCYYMNQLRCELSKGEIKIIPKVAYSTTRKYFEEPKESESDYFIKYTTMVKGYDYLFMLI